MPYHLEPTRHDHQTANVIVPSSWECLSSSLHLAKSVPKNCHTLGVGSFSQPPSYSSSLWGSMLMALVGSSLRYSPSAKPGAFREYRTDEDVVEIEGKQLGKVLEYFKVQKWPSFCICSKCFYISLEFWWVSVKLVDFRKIINGETVKQQF